MILKPIENSKKNSALASALNWFAENSKNFGKNFAKIRKSEKNFANFPENDEFSGNFPIEKESENFPEISFDFQKIFKWTKLILFVIFAFIYLLMLLLVFFA